MSVITNMDGYYFVLGKISIVADHPNAASPMKAAPDIPAINKATLDFICELINAKEAKLDLLLLFC